MPRQNGRHFPDDISKCIFLNENVWIAIKISLNCVPSGQINNIPPLVQIMAWRRPGDKPLSEPMMVCLLTHICVTRPQWVNHSFATLCLIALVTVTHRFVVLSMLIAMVDFSLGCRWVKINAIAKHWRLNQRLFVWSVELHTFFRVQIIMIILLIDYWVFWRKYFHDLV